MFCRQAFTAALLLAISRVTTASEDDHLCFLQQPNVSSDSIKLRPAATAKEELDKLRMQLQDDAMQYANVSEQKEAEQKTNAKLMEETRSLSNAQAKLKESLHDAAAADEEANKLIDKEKAIAGELVKLTQNLQAVESSFNEASTKKKQAQDDLVKITNEKAEVQKTIDELSLKQHPFQERLQQLIEKYDHVSTKFKQDSQLLANNLTQARLKHDELQAKINQGPSIGDNSISEKLKLSIERLSKENQELKLNNSKMTSENEDFVNQNKVLKSSIGKINSAIEPVEGV